MSDTSKDADRRRRTPSWVVLTLVVIAVIWLFRALVASGAEAEPVAYSQFRQDLENGRVAEMTIGEDRILYTTVDVDAQGDTARATHAVVPVDDPDLTADALAEGAPRHDAGAGRLLGQWRGPHDHNDEHDLLVRPADP